MKVKEAKPIGFAGYKAGMTHVQWLDTKKNSPTKGLEVAEAVTVIECPPLKIHGIRTYRKDVYGSHATTDYTAKADKNLSRRVNTKEKPYPETIECDFAHLLVHTQPSLTKRGQKKPEVFEIAFGGTPADALAYVKEHKEIKLSDVLKSGQFVDIHGITRGHGFVGPVKKAGIGIRRHKSEKTKRGNVMAPEGYAKVSFEANMPGKHGNHTRTEYNKKIVLVNTLSDKDVTPKGGFVRYGELKNDYLLIKGSVPGLKHALVRINLATRKDPKASEDAPAIEYIHLGSQQ